jgi:hypothetical protein
MKRTSIVLTDELAMLIEREGRRRGVPAATVVRDALDVYFSARPEGVAIVGFGRSNETRVSQDMEEILAREWTYERIMGVVKTNPAQGCVRELSEASDTLPVSTDGRRRGGWTRHGRASRWTIARAAPC